LQLLALLLAWEADHPPGGPAVAGSGRATCSQLLLLKPSPTGGERGDSMTETERPPDGRPSPRPAVAELQAVLDLQPALLVELVEAARQAAVVLTPPAPPWPAPPGPQLTAVWPAWPALWRQLARMLDAVAELAELTPSHCGDPMRYLADDREWFCARCGRTQKGEQ
jgi:hypothetical protein